MQQAGCQRTEDANDDPYVVRHCERLSALYANADDEIAPWFTTAEAARRRTGEHVEK